MFIERRKEKCANLFTTYNQGHLARSVGEGNGNPLQYSCLENPMDFPMEEPGRLQSMGSLRVGHN